MNRSNLYRWRLKFVGLLSEDNRKDSLLSCINIICPQGGGLTRYWVEKRSAIEYFS
jgi:hypothetical protein